MYHCFALFGVSVYIIVLPDSVFHSILLFCLICCLKCTSISSFCLIRCFSVYHCFAWFDVSAYMYIVLVYDLIRCFGVCMFHLSIRSDAVFTIVLPDSVFQCISLFCYLTWFGVSKYIIGLQDSMFQCWSLFCLIQFFSVKDCFSMLPDSVSDVYHCFAWLWDLVYIIVHWSLFSHTARFFVSQFQFETIKYFV